MNHEPCLRIRISSYLTRRFFTKPARLAQSVERETLKILVGTNTDQRHLKVAGSTPASGSIPDASH
ncbi:uncharacterized protein F4812DRAFT_463908 [Daldinia caldariorum]|uniref:uncharacterized protein n=1 Tax=Daldinia caldariorum TaxID=326644 RepID=UPI0020084A64|nr:uncharacterized protein F4812DRAFT_463908 [Daldinia caldariorum]KAI1463215.1 hypothetical protein F4812DRAFT_463908 [Daldinia caldariorum]